MKTKFASSLRAALAGPRHRFRSALVLPLVAAALSFVSAHAQTITSSVPGLFNFQGKVANANGTLVGAGTPVNKTVIFRIWDHSSSSTTGNLVYSEQQNVTITDGEFSVLIGQGSAVTGTPLGYSETTKGPSTTTIASASVFAGANRYLGITIDDGNSATTDPEVTPRQQLVTSAYAFRAKYAESVGSNGVNVLTVLDSGNVGIGAANPSAKLDVAGNVRAGGVANASFVLANADNNAVGTVGTASSAGSLSSDAAVNDVVVRASAGKLLLQSGAGASALVIDANNRVGIGTSAPNAALDVNGALMLKGALTNASGRPTVGTSRVAAEIGGYGSGGAGNDDGFLRLSAGGGTTASSKSFIDLSGFSTVADMDNALVFGTRATERMRITSLGALLLKNALTNASPRPAAAASRLPAEIAGYGSGGMANDDGFLRLSAGGGTNANTKSYIDFSGYSTVADMDRNLIFGTAGTERMRIDVNGYIGIGGIPTTSAKLAVFTPNNATSSATFRFNNTAATDSWIHYGATGDIYWRSGATNGKVVLQDTGGFVGIGTSSPSYPLHISGGPAQGGFVGTYLNNAAFGGPVTHGTHQISLYTTHTILSGGSIIAISDARVKSILGRSNSAADLATLMQVEITDYRYKDTVAKGNGSAKKVIAQQVEKIFPQAVRQVTDVVPDIYQAAKTEGDWIALATDLKQGERVKLIGDDGEKISDVAEVKPGRFRTTERPKGEKVFVYGREVKDFRAVDYDAIAMLNVSATQEIKREKDAEIAELKKRVAELEAKDRARDAKLAAIEKLLTSSSTVMALPAKPATANGQD